MTIHRETFGTGEPIVLVHGWAMHSGIWRDFALALAKHYQVTVVDLPGHGQSDAISPFTLETVSQALIESINAEKCCWLGWSLGAEIVLEIAKRYPKYVKKIILLAGTPCFVNQGAWPGMDEMVLDSFFQSLTRETQTTLLRFLALQVQGLADWKVSLQQLKANVLAYTPPDLATLAAGLALLKQADLRDVFAELNIPIAVILGEKDALVPVKVGVKCQELNPRIQLTIIENAGHAPFLSHRDAVVTVIEQFMNNHVTS